MSLSHSWVYYSRVYVSKSLSCDRNHILSVKLHSACRNQSCASWNHTRACCNHNRVCIVITIVRVKITMRVEITLCVYKSHCCVSLSDLWVSYSHAYVSTSLSCGNLSLRVETNLVRVKITLERIVNTLISLKITLVYVEITLCGYCVVRVESHLRAFLNYTRTCCTCWPLYHTQYPNTHACDSFFKQPQLGLCLYYNKVVQCAKPNVWVWKSHAACQDHTRACNVAVCQLHGLILEFFLNFK
jgi:hypothetical protein